MVVFESTTTLAIVTLMWLAWRLWLWRRNGVNPVREAVVSVLFVWCLVMVHLTFFPMVIIFYDWHSKVNLIPFASILQLITETNSTVAFENIVGNIVLFVPLGILLPVLFPKLEPAWSLAWRAGVISVAIELAQVFTRARSIDIDDVLLNVTGGVIGWMVYRLIARIGRAFPGFARLLDRAATDTSREPLLRSVVPIALTAAIVLPMMASAIFAETLGEGPDGIVGFATSEWPGSTLLARNDVAEHTYLLVGMDGSPNEGLRLYDFERPLPGRYTWVSTGKLPSSSESVYTWSITAFNTARNEIPTIFVWGSNAVGATKLTATTDTFYTEVEIPPGDAFVIGFPFDVEAHPTPDGRLQDFDFRFFDGAGAGLTEHFSLVR